MMSISFLLRSVVSIIVLAQANNVLAGQGGAGSSKSTATLGSSGRAARCSILLGNRQKPEFRQEIQVSSTEIVPQDESNFQHGTRDESHRVNLQGSVSFLNPNHLHLQLSKSAKARLKSSRGLSLDFEYIGLWRDEDIEHAEDPWMEVAYEYRSNHYDLIIESYPEDNVIVYQITFPLDGHYGSYLIKLEGVEARKLRQYLEKAEKDHRLDGHEEIDLGDDVLDLPEPDVKKSSWKRVG